MRPFFVLCVTYLRQLMAKLVPKGGNYGKPLCNHLWVFGQHSVRNYTNKTKSGQVT